MADWEQTSCDTAELIKTHSSKLQSILARRGGDWGFSGTITPTQIADFAQMVSEHSRNATEVWQTPYRGSDRLFLIIGDKVVVLIWTGRLNQPGERRSRRLPIIERE